MSVFPDSTRCGPLTVLAAANGCATILWQPPLYETRPAIPLTGQAAAILRAEHDRRRARIGTHRCAAPGTGEAGSQSHSLHALVGGQIIELRVLHPMGFFAKGLEGRIDDPNAGWKGRELRVTSGNRTPFHI
jgi:hypothetical protein